MSVQKSWKYWGRNYFLNFKTCCLSCRWPYFDIHQQKNILLKEREKFGRCLSPITLTRNMVRRSFFSETRFEIFSSQHTKKYLYKQANVLHGQIARDPWISRAKNKWLRQTRGILLFFLESQISSLNAH